MRYRPESGPYGPSHGGNRPSVVGGPVKGRWPRPEFRAPYRRGTRQRGFTLIEILAAFVVFALAFGAVMQALSGSIRNTVQSRGYTQAALMARSKMDTLGVTEAIEPGGDRGELAEGYRYDLEIREWEPPEEAGPDGNIQPRVVLYRVHMTVEWGEAPSVRRAEFTTLRAVQPEL